MSMIARLAVMFFIGSAITILAGLLLGQIIGTVVIADFYTLEDRTYNLEIRDSRRMFRLKLVGTRCFDPLPPWAEADDSEPSSTPNGQFWQKRFQHAWNAVKDIQCNR